MSHIVGGVGNCLPLANENKVRHYIYTQRTSRMIDNGYQT